ncbi:MAG: excinuclease ABC subunit UvrA [Bacteroidetes bacterium]|nr:excinuclease ABC subunit UvrA [Bacteroidota bacterium]MBK9555855.1 excinuclease ABC subunit UvrA [Bacteroidota bacterium]MBL0279375.1 excinuclease ABC subunit UvrA [Bacteroidota bacterium]
MSDKDVTYLEVQGARVHNLKNINVNIPRNSLVVITGVSGSGKSSLAFDTIYAEGQRRYMESFSAYARQFFGAIERPDVDNISGLSPVISIEQKTTNKNPRSTVGTITEIYDFMRLLYARASDAYSYATGEKMVRFTEEQIIQSIITKFNGKRIVLLAPVVRGRKGHYRELFEQIRKQGFLKVRIDGEIKDLIPKMQVDRYKMHDIEIVIDRFKVDEDDLVRIKQSVAQALKSGKQFIMVMDADKGTVFNYSKKLMCLASGISYEEPSPNTFSFNSPYGACPKCKGLGVVYEVNLETLIPDKSKTINNGGIVALGEFKDNILFKQIKSISTKYKFNLSTPIKDIPKKGLNAILFGNEGDAELPEDDTVFLGETDRWYTLEFGGLTKLIKRCFSNSISENMRRWAEDFMEKATCDECNGTRLKKEALYFKVDEKNIAELALMDIKELNNWFSDVDVRMNAKQQVIAKDILKEIRARIGFIQNVGLDYLSLDRPTRTLSGGESQRIRLATQIGSQLVGITYILDEPSIGLHQRDNNKLIEALKDLRDSGNTVLVVEHDKDMMMHADYVIDLGPGAGIHGGELVGEGDPVKFMQANTLTADYLNEQRKIEYLKTRRKGNGKEITLQGATGHNLKDVAVKFPLGVLICVTGVSGSGKSSLINGTLFPIMQQYYYNSLKKPLPYKKIDGLKNIDKVIEIDQSPIGRTPRSNPVTYIDVFSEIRNLFAMVPEAKIRGYKAGRFSFNVKGGRCDVCEGGGMKVIEMNFLPDVYVECEKCRGKRYNRETLEIYFKGKNIADVLDMTVDHAADFFENHPRIFKKIKTLQEVGLGYIRLGQSSTTLSGGEAQRVKLAEELSRKDTGNTFYILDEPTTGLHFEDIRVLMNVINDLVDKGNTVLIIEHNLDVIKLADHIIDLGPEGGAGGGNILVEGTPEQVAKHTKSHTGKYLKIEMKL